MRLWAGGCASKGAKAKATGGGAHAKGIAVRQEHLLPNMPRRDNRCPKAGREADKTYAR